MGAVPPRPLFMNASGDCRRSASLLTSCEPAQCCAAGAAMRDRRAYKTLKPISVSSQEPWKLRDVDVDQHILAARGGVPDAPLAPHTCD
eukprot:358975-Chlamydomonas_euryale.AAC.3